ncbi:MAG: TlpA family protein disulfide reductase [Nocardioidaceae bacterium]
MSRTARAVAGTLTATVLLVAGCTSAGGQNPSHPPADDTRSHAPVDTPELRHLRHVAGIEPCPSTGQAGEPVDGGLPPVELPCLGGGDPVRLSGLRGEPTVVNLWASWCKPCRKELPHLQQLHDRAGDRVRVIGIDFQDASPEAALHLAAAAGVTYPLLADPEGATRKDLGVIGLPQTVFVDRSGRIVATERREVTSYGQLVDLVRKHLKVTP